MKGGESEDKSSVQTLIGEGGRGILKGWRTRYRKFPHTFDKLPSIIIKVVFCEKFKIKIAVIIKKYN